MTSAIINSIMYQDNWAQLSRFECFERLTVYAKQNLVYYKKIYSEVPQKNGSI